jgi:hypothetical protein
MASIAAGAVQALTISAGSAVSLLGVGVARFLTGANVGQVASIAGPMTIGPFAADATVSVHNMGAAAMSIDFVLSASQKIVKNTASVTTPFQSLTGVTTGTAFAISQIVIPGCRIPDNADVHVIARMKRTNANATAQFDAYLGTAGDLTDSLLGRVQSTATDGHVGYLDTKAQFGSSLTSFIANGTAAPQSSTGGGTHVDRSTNVNRCVPMILTLAMTTANAADVFALTQYEVRISV